MQIAQERERQHEQPGKYDVVQHLAVDFDGTIWGSMSRPIRRLSSTRDIYGSNYIDSRTYGLFKRAIRGGSILTARLYADVQGDVERGSHPVLKNFFDDNGVDIAFGNGAIVRTHGYPSEHPLLPGDWKSLATAANILNPAYIVAQVHNEIYTYFRKYPGREAVMSHINNGSLQPGKVYLGDYIADLQLNTYNGDLKKASSILNSIKQADGHKNVRPWEFLKLIREAGATKITLCGCNVKDPKQISKLLQGLDLTYQLGYPGNVSINSHGINKLTALMEIAQKRGISLDHVLFAGNDSNDKEPLFSPDIGVKVFVGSLEDFFRIFDPYEITEAYFKLRQTDIKGREFFKRIDRIRLRDKKLQAATQLLESLSDHREIYDFAAQAYARGLLTGNEIFGPKIISPENVDYFRLKVKKQEGDQPVEIFVVSDPIALADFIEAVLFQQENAALRADLNHSQTEIDFLIEEGRIDLDELYRFYGNSIKNSGSLLLARRNFITDREYKTLDLGVMLSNIGQLAFD